jgi:hypothetical protein
MEEREEAEWIGKLHVRACHFVPEGGLGSPLGSPLPLVSAIPEASKRKQRPWHWSVT